MYTIYFCDNTSFQGGNLKDSLWSKIPENKIQKLVYYLGGRKAILEGYQAYNHLIERIVVGNKEKILKIILMGKIGMNVESLILDFACKKILKTITLYGKEYNNKPTLGWKMGEGSLTPTIKMETI